MIIPILAAALSCPPTKIVNKTDTWTEMDIKTLEFNKNLCAEKYKDAVCMKLFIKRKENTYWIICGEGQK